MCAPGPPVSTTVCSTPFDAADSGVFTSRVRRLRRASFKKSRTRPWPTRLDSGEGALKSSAARTCRWLWPMTSPRRASVRPTRSGGPNSLQAATLPSNLFPGRLTEMKMKKIVFGVGALLSASSVTSGADRANQPVTARRTRTDEPPGLPRRRRLSALCADALGNRVEDFSDVGYLRGTVPLPGTPGGVTVPVRVTLSPAAGDQTARIQAAIDQVSQLPRAPTDIVARCSSHAESTRSPVSS